MKKIVLCLVIVFGIQFGSVITTHAAGIQFGGPVVSWSFCPEGALIGVGFPAPAFILASWTNPFMFGPPFKIGQYILGNYVPTPITCFGFPIPGGMGISNFYGTSL